MLGTRLKLLRVRLLLRVIVLLLIVVWLLARIILLRLARGEWLATDMRLLVVSLVITLVGTAELARLLLLLIVRRLTLPKLLLGRGDQPKIMLSVLVIVFRCNWIARALRVARQLEIFFPNVGRRSANFYVRSIGLVHSG